MASYFRCQIFYRYLYFCRIWNKLVKQIVGPMFSYSYSLTSKNKWNMILTGYLQELMPKTSGFLPSWKESEINQWFCKISDISSIFWNFEDFRDFLESEWFLWDFRDFSLHFKIIILIWDDYILWYFILVASNFFDCIASQAMTYIFFSSGKNFNFQPKTKRLYKLLFPSGFFFFCQSRDFLLFGLALPAWLSN